MPGENPILNNPYEEPLLHYATNLAGELDYSMVKEGRRVFTPDVQSIPVRSGPQKDLLEINEYGAAFGDELVNLIRREVKAWRSATYPNTTRVTRELLAYWFLNSTRENRLFYAQREAIETAIWLNEIPTRTDLQTAFAERKIKLSIEEILAEREQPIRFRITKDLIRDHFSDDPGWPAFHRFAELFVIVGEWYRTKVKVLGKGPEWKKLLYYWDPKKLVAAVARGIAARRPGRTKPRIRAGALDLRRELEFIDGPFTEDFELSPHSGYSKPAITFD